MAERITFKTTDGVEIVGDWVTAPTTFGAVVLLHMMPLDRTSWRAFQQALSDRGLASLAIDLRGHGESLESSESGKLDYTTFSDEEHQSSLLDAIGAFDWIRRRGFEPTRISACGASIGANLAVQLLLEQPQMSGAALLSPGSNYHGTNAVSDAASVLDHQGIWIAASEGDDQESFEAAQAVSDAASSTRKTMVPLKNAGHGTAMLQSHPELVANLADWLKETIQG
ncbi:alpha/beta fold hydrolase [Candidatus Uhrbacteria bacterium]|nr:alpha/beta fold hydrolase [Candidatus Uhrbacteria bacterium]